ncbi:MAG: hypothetical protein PSW75_01815 [bacterium]|nr:hypothetical protein [bacterium]MDI1336294.1 hypothetical protein [Lacunisphaera sp.]
MIRRIIFSLAGLLAVQAAAVIVEVNLPYKDLRLKDGMLLGDAVVKSVNTAAGTVLLQVNKELVSVRHSLLPDEVRARLQALSPAQSKEELVAEKAQETADRLKSADRAERRQKQAEEEAQAVRAANRSLNVKAAEQNAARLEARPDEVAKFAEQRAQAYFKYQADPLSNIGAVLGSDVYLDNPESVPGWTGRYRVEGSSYRQYVNSRASGFDRSHKDFEMLIQTYDNKKPELVEIRIK